MIAFYCMRVYIYYIFNDKIIKQDLQAPGGKKTAISIAGIDFDKKK